MDKDPLVRTVDPTSMRLQLQRRGPGRIQGHPLWQEAELRMRERLSFIRLEDGPVLQHGVAQYGQSMEVAPASLQRIESVGLLSALADARSTLAFWARSLKPGGLLMFVTLGPDSFRQLGLALGTAARGRLPRYARHWRRAGGAAHDQPGDGCRMG